LSKTSTAEASTLGWRPGYSPNAIFHDSKVFVKVAETELFWTYQEVQDDGVTVNPDGDVITVFND
jgi:hypothetical protein